MWSFNIFLAALLALFGQALTNKVIFINKDSTPREICWYPGATEGSDPGHPIYYPNIPGTWVPANGRGETPKIVYGGQYMFKAIYPGGDCTDMHNVEGEVKFNGFEGKTHFDLSVVRTNDFGLGPQNSHIHWLRVASGTSPVSGCSTFPCDNVYVFDHDKGKVKSDSQHDLTTIICGGPCNAD